MKILVIQQKMIGDVLTTSILFEAIKQKYPNAETHYVINSHTFPVVEHNPFIDEFIFITKDIESSKRKFYAFLMGLKTTSYDYVIDVYGKLSSNLISRFANATHKITYKKKHTSLIYNHQIQRLRTPSNSVSLAIENRMRLLEPLDIYFKAFTPKIYLTNQEIDQAETYLGQSKINLDRPLFMISVLGSSPEKTYPFAYMAKLLDTIVDCTPESQILFNYIPKQKDDAKVIYDLCSEKTQAHIYFEVFGKNLREFLAITKHCDALIGNEGGANNMAKALNVKTFTIFSPYLNKGNWFGKQETKNHTAVHLSDFINYTENDVVNAKKQPKAYYLKFNPEFIIPQLRAFLSTLD